MSKRPENSDQNLINRIKSNIGQCFESIDALITNYEIISEQKDILIAENESLIEELDSLKYEMESLRKEKEIYRSQLIEKSNENELLLAKLCEKDVLHQKAMDFARNMLSRNHVPIELQSNL
jgi:cell division protein FtsB